MQLRFIFTTRPDAACGGIGKILQRAFTPAAASAGVDPGNVDPESVDSMSVDKARSGVQLLLPSQIRIDPTDEGGGGGGEVRRELHRALSSLPPPARAPPGDPPPADGGGRVLVLDTIMRECGLTASDLQVSAFQRLSV